MTVPNNKTKEIYLWDNVTTEFAYPQIQEAENLLVELYDTDGALVQVIEDSKYSLSTEEAAGVLTITDSATLAVDAYKIVLQRVMDYTQELDLGERDFPPEEIEKQFDKDTMTLQQLEEFQSRSIVSNILDESGEPAELPLSSEGKVIVWNADGDFVNSTANFDDVITDATAQAVIATTQAGLASTSASNAATSETNAETSATEASDEADRAEGYAEAINLPTAVASTYLRQKSDLSGYETLTAEEVKTDIGLPKDYINGGVVSYVDSNSISIIAGACRNYENSNDITITANSDITDTLTASTKYYVNIDSSGTATFSTTEATGTNRSIAYLSTDSSGDIIEDSITQILPEPYETRLSQGGETLWSGSSGVSTITLSQDINDYKFIQFEVDQSSVLKHYTILLVPDFKSRTLSVPLLINASNSATDINMTLYYATDTSITINSANNLTLTKVVGIK